MKDEGYDEGGNHLSGYDVELPSSNPIEEEFKEMQREISI
jgi:hypothetical protein